MCGYVRMCACHNLPVEVRGHSYSTMQVLDLELASAGTVSPNANILFKANIFLHLYRILEFYFILWN